MEKFPASNTIHRTTFCRQTVNLWAVKEELRRSVGEVETLR
jgi:hypothetical protein